MRALDARTNNSVTGAICCMKRVVKVTRTRSQLAWRCALFLVVSAPPFLACGSEGTTFSASLLDYTGERLTSRSDDRLFLVSIEAFTGDFATSELTVTTSRGAVTCAHELGDEYLRAGSLLLCREPQLNLFDDADSNGDAVPVVLRRTTLGHDGQVSTDWIPRRPTIAADAGILEASFR